jgi:hypothetical protein
MIQNGFRYSLRFGLPKLGQVYSSPIQVWPARCLIRQVRISQARVRAALLGVKSCSRMGFKKALSRNVVSEEAGRRDVE